MSTPTSIRSTLTDRCHEESLLPSSPAATPHYLSIPPSIIVEYILPFLDRATYDDCILANKEVFETSKTVSFPPWPQKCLQVGSEVSCVAFSSSNKAVACGCENGAVFLWQNRTGHRITLKGHEMEVLNIVFSPTEHVLASGSVDCTVRLWFLKKEDLTPTGEITIFRGHENPVHSISFLPNSDILASSSHERMIRLWNVSTSKRVGRIPHPDKVESLSVSPDGKLVASATWEGTVRLWELSDDCQLGRSVVLGKGLPLTKVQFSQDGKFLYGLRGFRIRRWNMADGSLSYMSGNRVHRVFSIAVSPDSDYVAYGDRDGTIRLSKLADALSRGCFKDTFYGHHHQCSLTFAPNGRTLASGSPDGTFRLWNI
jgi:WD40 repeat protein